MVKNNEVHKNSCRQTEIGQIPNDWDMVSMEGLGKTYGGLTGKTKKDFQNGQYPYITFLNILLHPIINSEKFDYVNIRRSENQNKAIVGDLFFNGSSETPEEIGMCSVLLDSFESLYLNSFCFGYRLFNTKTINPLFVSYFFRSPLGRKVIYSLAQGATRYNLSKTNFLKLQIPLPKIEEQTAIATALSDTDALIESLEKLIEKKRNIKQGVMQELLKPKKGWKETKLFELLDYEQPTNYIVQDTEYTQNDIIPVLTAGKTFILGYTSEEFGVFNNLSVIIFDDFTTASKYVDFSFKVKSSAMKILKPKNCKIDLRFVFEIIQRIRFPVSDHKRYWISEYKNIEVYIPEPAEQERISRIISDLADELNELQKKLNKYRMIKQGMMQVLLTGKIRLV